MATAPDETEARGSRRIAAKGKAAGNPSQGRVDVGKGSPQLAGVVLRCRPQIETKIHVKCRVCSERRNRPRRSQRDPTRNLLSQEVFDDLPFRDRSTEAASARARAPATASRPGRAGASSPVAANEESVSPGTRFSARAWRRNDGVWACQLPNAVF
jgi:hypothetical protein